MFTLAPGDTLAAATDDVASQVICTVFGMELATAEAYKALAQQAVASSPATIYTAPASPATTAFIRTITVVNNDAVAAHTFQLFNGGTSSAHAISPPFVIPARGSATYEDGLGWSVSTIGAGTTLLNDVHSGYQDWDAIANPAAPGADILRVFARKLAGRMVPKWVPPSGLDTPFQPALFGNNVIMYAPTSGTTVTGGFGTLWAKGGSAGVVNTPTPASTSPAIVSQMKRTRHVNAVTTTNQAMGIISTAAGLPQFWRGNAAGLGGFFFFARFAIELWASNTDRLFVGLTPGTAEVVTSNTVANNSVGLWHDDTDGANVLYFMTRDGSTTHKGSAIAGATLAAGQAYDFYMYAKPNDSTIYYRLDDINAGVTLIDSSETNNLPTATVFLGPQVEISNGASDITVTTVGIGVNRIYVESDH